jgi:hypothetical protein
MITLVSAFVYLGKDKSFKTFDEYFSNGIKLLKLDIPKVIFMDKSIIGSFYEYQNLVTIILPTSLDGLYLSDYAFENDVISTNKEKDTPDYFRIQCNKTEWVREAINRADFKSGNYIWIDFGIFHILKEPEFLFENIVSSNYNSSIRIGSIWDISVLPCDDLYHKIQWYFAGGIFGGSPDTLLKFADLVKEKCLDIIYHKHTLMWEVNIWYLVYLQNKNMFNIYRANHDNTLIQKYTLT